MKISLDKPRFVWYIIVEMNNKTEIAFSNHIKRLEKDIAEAQTRIKELHLSNDGMEAINNRDDAKKIALLREGVVPKYSDLPEGKYGNNLPAIEMFEFSDITDPTAAATHDLDLIDHGKALAGMPRPETNDPNPDFDYENYKGYHEEDDGLASS
jgi:hypothetical protein